MPASYPASIKTFTPRVDGAGNIIFAAIINDLQDEANAVETGLLSGFAHVLRPDASANNRDLGLTTARWRDLFLGRTIDIAQGTLAADTQALAITGTWNAGAVAFTSIKLNITDTASAAASLLADLQVGGVSKFKVQKDGLVTTGGAVVLPANPTTALQAATKQYADLMLPLVGGVSMTGLFNLSGDPSAALHPATKQYVDARFEGQAHNAAAVTTTSAGVTIATLSLGTVVTGDLIYVTSVSHHTKGVTGGRTLIRVEKDSGTAVISGAQNENIYNTTEQFQDASTTHLYSVAGIFKVTTGGTLTLRVAIFSDGSDGTVSANTGGLRVVTQRN